MQKHSSSSPVAPDDDDNTPLDIPEKFTCPITQELLQDPVLSRYGQNYERSAIVEWLAAGNKGCPMTRQPLCLRDVISNPNLRAEIRRWQVENEADITVIMNSSGDGQEDVCGYIDIPSKQERRRRLARLARLEDTERTEEDEDFVSEQEPARVSSSSRSSASSTRSRRRLRSRRQQSEEPAAAQPEPISQTVNNSGSNRGGFFRRLRSPRPTTTA
jgi:U-box domain